MAAKKSKWPECECRERCHLRKCQAIGNRKFQASARPGSATNHAHAPEKLKLVLKLAAEVPVEGEICRMAGMSRNALCYALMRSQEGGPGDIFDVKLADGTTERFHILFQDAIETATDKLEELAIEMATGTYKKPLEYQGRVTYKRNRTLAVRGLPEEGSYLRDENGNLIPETVPSIDPDMTRWVLARRRPDEYGKRLKAPKEPQRTGGVLVVANAMSREEYEKRFSGSKPPVEKPK